MGAPGRKKDTVIPPDRLGRPVDRKRAMVVSIMNLQAWPEHALHTVQTTATVIGAIAAAVVLLCLFLMYLSGSELTGRIKAKAEAPTSNPPSPRFRKDRPNGEKASPAPLSQPAYASRISQLEKELEAARRAEAAKSSRLAELEGKLSGTLQSEDAKASRLTQLEGELANVRRLEEAKRSQLSQLEGKLTETQRAEQTKAARLTQLETELADVHRSDEQKAVRLVELETQLKTARQSADQAQAETKRVESRRGPRSITPDQRKQFLDAIRGLPTGKILVSAFFENKETHEFGAELLSLFKDAGFAVVERTPVNFFTTSRPSSGIRIGCQDVNQAPPHYATVRKGLETIGIDAPMTSIVNAQEPDVVEIQITPKQ